MSNQTLYFSGVPFYWCSPRAAFRCVTRAPDGERCRLCKRETVSLVREADLTPVGIWCWTCEWIESVLDPPDHSDLAQA